MFEAYVEFDTHNVSDYFLTQAQARTWIDEMISKYEDTDGPVIHEDIFICV